MSISSVYCTAIKVFVIHRSHWKMGENFVWALLREINVMKITLIFHEGGMHVHVCVEGLCDLLAEKKPQLAINLGLLLWLKHFWMCVELVGYVRIDWIYEILWMWMFVVCRLKIKWWSVCRLRIKWLKCMSIMNCSSYNQR